MSEFNLFDCQLDAISKLESGNVLVGKVGSGKTLTALSFYLSKYKDKKLYVITTAKKRDSKDWEKEGELVGISDLVVDSWNNIKKYEFIKDSFFIFDEQRITGYGVWSKTFIRISKCNKWILLSATPGDWWMDYIPLFIANGFYRNKTDFERQHVVYDRFVKFPKVKFFLNERKLEKLRAQILLPMDSIKKTKRHHHKLYFGYDKVKYSKVIIKRWNVFKNRPIKNPSELTQCSRRVVATSEERIKGVEDLLALIDRAIIFYNYNYELEILENICKKKNYNYSQWNGHKHEDILSTKKWLYLVHYASAEGWNCVETNTIIFYSMNYSYKIMEQAEGRIDRLNTPYTDLHYYYIGSRSSIEQSIFRAIKKKEKFNESAWGKKYGKEESMENRK